MPQELCPHQSADGAAASFSLRAKSRLRRLRFDTRLRAQPRGGSTAAAAPHTERGAPAGHPSVSKNLPLRDRLPRYGGGGACARGGAVPRRGGGREPCHSPKYFGQPYSSLPHRLRAEPPRRGGQGVSTPFSTVYTLPATSRRQVVFLVPFLLRKGTNPRLVKITSGQSPQPRRPAPAGPAGSARPSGR